MTTGYGLPTRADGLRTWVERLVDQGASGLAVELGLTYDGTVPVGLVRACERLGLPLIVFHRRVAFVELTEAIHQRISDYAGVLARAAESVETRVMDMLLRDCGLDEVLDVIADAVGAPVVLETQGGQVVHMSVDGAVPEAVARALADLHRYDDGSANDSAHSVELPRHGGRVIALALLAPFGEIQRQSFDRAVRALALDHSTRPRAVRLNAQSKGQFLDDLASGRLSSRHADDLAGLLGLGSAGPVVVAVARRRDSVARAMPWDDVATALQTALHQRGMEVMVGTHDDELLCAARVRTEAVESRSRIARLLSDSLAELGVDVGGRLLAVSGPSKGWAAIGADLARVQRRGRTAALLPERDWYDATESDVVDLLDQVSDPELLREFVVAQLGPLAVASPPNTVRLETLRALVLCGGNKAAAARMLHVDRGSLYQRIKYIEEQVGRDLGDPRVLLGIHVALEAMAVLHQRTLPSG